MVSFPPPIWMLPFGGFPLPYGSSPGITRGGKSHSGISGSKAACAYPELIAACHALRQRPSRAIRQAAYHAKPFRNPHSICVNSEASSTQHFIVDPALRWVSLRLSSLSRHVLRVAFYSARSLSFALQLVPVLSKEVIRPQVPLRPPCYDFSPLT